MMGPFRDDRDALRLRADALENELARERRENARLRGVDAESARLRALVLELRGADADNARLRAPLLRRIWDYLFDGMPAGHQSLGQILALWLVIGIAIAIIVGVAALAR